MVLFRGLGSLSKNDDAKRTASKAHICQLLPKFQRKLFLNQARELDLGSKRKPVPSTKSWFRHFFSSEIKDLFDIFFRNIVFLALLQEQMTRIDFLQSRAPSGDFNDGWCSSACFVIISFPFWKF